MSRKADTGTANLPMTHLGEQMTSIYAPAEVMRGSVFQIIVFFHYDSERGIVKLRAERWQTNAIIREELDIPVHLDTNDTVDITLDFYSTDNENIRIKGNEYRKTIAITRELAFENFIVEVTQDFHANSFLANVEMAKEATTFIRCAFNINIAERGSNAPAEVLAEVPRLPVSTEDILTCYADVFTGRLFGHKKLIQFQGIMSKKNDCDGRLLLLRRFAYHNGLFVEQLRSVIENQDKELSSLLLKDAREKSEITYEIVPLFKSYMAKLVKKLDTLNGKFQDVRMARGRENAFEEALPRIPALEASFIDLAEETRLACFQIDMLKVFRELREKLATTSKEDIKELAKQFWEHPHKDEVDKELFDIFRERGGTETMIASSSKGVSRPFLALLLAMVCGEYSSVDNGKREWTINVAQYIDFSGYAKKDSLRKPKREMNRFVGLLIKPEIREMIKQYRQTDAGEISISAYYLQKVKVYVV